eukprot:GFUD01088325.1.p1 GENE.GFUD01088325.1~~GFUD01088325.1.p1  ORF type:complete len:500 (+),score=173.43 GFUD01088325.1:39-1538(+)
MSNIYVQEPPCEGKVCLETTVGEIDIELWSRECPKACRNFVQLCLEGYYDKTKFFRVVPDFIVQGGDPTNTGSGGDSIFGVPFKDEFHSRLRMVRRGLVAMANSGKDDNGSQFFFTLAATKELQNKHTVFGKVVGDTIFNMIRLAEGHLEDGDRPKYPHKIIRTRVLINPFPDIIPREGINQEIEKGKKSKPKSKMKATKDFKLLSFGEEAEDDEESIDVASKSSKGKGKSAHDLAADPNLLKGIDEEDSDSSEEESEDDEEKKAAELNSIKDKFLKRKAEKEMMTIRTKLKKTDVVEEFLQKEQMDNKDDFEGEYECPLKKERMKRKEEVQKELKALTKEFQFKKKKDIVEDEPVEERMTEKERNNDMLLEYHKEQKKYKAKESIPKKKASREEETLAILAKFKNKLSGIKVDEEEQEESIADQKEAVDDDEEYEGDDWMKNTLRFDANDPVVAKDASTKDDDWFDIYDPRNPLNKRRRDKDKVEGDKKEKDRMKMAL